MRTAPRRARFTIKTELKSLRRAFKASRNRSIETNRAIIMPLSAIDSIFLYTHGFFNLYDIYRDRLLVIAKGTYQRLKARSGISPSPLNCENSLKSL